MPSVVGEMTKGASFDYIVDEANVGNETSLSEKGSPVSADVVVILDSEDSNSKKKAQVGNLPGGGGASALDDLSDVTITSVTNDEVFQYTGAGWENQTLTEAGIAASSHTHATSDVTSGTFADARISESSVTQHVAAIDHDSLLNFSSTEHFTMLDEDDFASDSNTQAATQQSIKAYIAEQLTVSIINTIDETSYNLYSAAYSDTGGEASDYVLNSIEFNFSAALSKTITVTSPDGTKLYEDTNTSQHVSLTDINLAINGGENFSVAVTQTASACTMDCIAKVTQ